jgi:hypothetical protein
MSYFFMHVHFNTPAQLSSAQDTIGVVEVHSIAHKSTLSATTLPVPAFIHVHIHVHVHVHVHIHAQTHHSDRDQGGGGGAEVAW